MARDPLKVTHLTAMVLSTAMTTAWAVGQAVFVGDSPGAAQALVRAQAMLGTDVDSALELLEAMVLEHGDALLESPDDPDLYRPARDIVNELAHSDDRLRPVRSPLTDDPHASARRALAEGRFSHVDRLLETGRFDPRTRAVFAGIVAMGRGDAQALADATAWLRTEGFDADAQALADWSQDQSEPAVAADAMAPALDATVLGLVDKPFWRLDRPDRALETLPVLLDDGVLVHSGHVIERIDAMTGDIDWRRDLRHAGAVGQGPTQTVQRVAATSDTVAVVSGIGGATRALAAPVLTALDPDTGAVRWSVDPTWTLIDGGQRTAWPAGFPTLSDGVVLLPIRRSGRARMTESWLAAFDADTGSTLWTTFLGSTASARTRTRRSQTCVVVDGSEAVLVSPVGVLACVRVADGGIRWLRRLAPSSELSAQRGTRMPWAFNAPVLADDTVSVLEPDGSGLIRVDRASGRVRSRDDGSNWSNVHYITAAGDGLMAVGNALEYIDQQGRARWTRPLDAGDPAAGRILVTRDVVLVPHAGRVDLLAIEDARLLESLDAIGGGQLVAGPAGLTMVGYESVQTWVDLVRARDHLTTRAREAPEDVTSVSTLITLATRASDRTLLLDWLEPGIRRASADSGRAGEVLDAVVSATDLLDPTNADDIAVLDVARRELPQTPAQAARLDLALGDWFGSVDPDEARRYWRMVLGTEDLSRSWIREGTIRAPAGALAAARLRLHGHPTSWSHPPVTDTLDGRLSAIWHGHGAGHTQGHVADVDSLVQDCMDARRPRAALAVSALSGAPVPDQARLQDAPELNAPATSSPARLWPGTLVGHDGALGEDAFLRRQGHRLVLHSGDALEPSWVTVVPQDGVIVAHRWGNDLLLLTQHVHGLGACRIDADSGAIRWRVEDLSGHIGPPVGPSSLITSKGRSLNQTALTLGCVDDDTIVLARRDGTVGGFDATTGALRWTTRVPGGQILTAGRWIDGTAVLTPTHLVHLESPTGHRREVALHEELGEPTWMNVGPLGRVAVCGTQGVALACHPHEALWWVNTDEHLHGARGALLLPGSIVVMSALHAPVALDPITGRIQPHSMIEPGDRLVQVRDLGDGALILDDRRLSRIAADGQPRWRTTGPGGERLLAIPAGHDTLEIASVTSPPVPLGLGADRHSTWHQIRRLDRHGRIRGVFDLFPVAGKIRSAWTHAGALVLGTDTEVVVIDLPDTEGGAK